MKTTGRKALGSADWRLLMLVVGLAAWAGHGYAEDAAASAVSAVESLLEEAEVLGDDEGIASDEPASAQGASRRGERARRWLNQHPDLKAKIDTNQDGKVDNDEWRAAHKARVEKWLQNHPEAKAKMDANSDGKIDQSEWRLARQERSQKWFDNHPKLKEKADANGDGVVDGAEARSTRQEWREKRGFDRDNNPPGPRGGAGTNWENRPGPQGGPGVGPDRGYRRDRDNNPPGPRGGRGTNWENRPGPQGGPGAGPDRRGAKKRG